jgi:two-component system, NarL family, nitrate/nitrite response regulator NarL
VTYQILIVDDHPLVREGLASLVESLPGGVVTRLAGTAAEALALAEIHAPLDAVLLDCGLPDADGAALVTALRTRGMATPVVVISADDSPAMIERVMLAGASAFVSKSRPAAHILAALKYALLHDTQVHVPSPAATPGEVTPNTQPTLTARQLDILLMLDRGRTNGDIALDLGLSEKTVKNHVTALFRALHVESRLQAVRQARDIGLIV